MENFVLWGTMVNAAGIFAGAMLGVLLLRLGRGKNNKDVPDETGKEKISDAVFRAVGLCVLLVGLDGAIQGMVNGKIGDALTGMKMAYEPLPGENTLVVILSMAIGAALGTLIDLDGAINRLGAWVESKMRGHFGNVAQGFVSASLLFCVGSMAIVGPLNSGLLHDHTMLYTKTLLDTVSAIVFASSMGFGVALSSILVFLYQGLIALLAGWIAPLLSTPVIVTMSITGSLLIVAVGLNMIGATKIKVMNLVPAVFLPIAFVPLYELLLG